MQARSGLRPLPSSGSEKPRSSQPDVVIALADRERAERYLAQLSPNHRALVELCVFEDLSVREAAERLGLREGTAKSRMASTMNALEAIAKQFMSESERGGR